MVVLRDKEEQIQQLLEEGEKLSKIQLQHTNIIKKLRNKEKENESQITSLKYVLLEFELEKEKKRIFVFDIYLSARIEKLTNELDEAKKNLQEKEENEKQLKGIKNLFSILSQLIYNFLLETVKKLEKSAIHYEKECLSLKSLYDDAEEQIRSTKVALENSYR
jgi:hypothetical protein